METAATRNTMPVHLWVVGIIGLLWNSFGCYDYVMTKTDPANYLAGMGLGTETMAYMENLPAWLTVFWALGVWGSLAASLLLLARSRHAVTAFAVSLGAFLISQIAEFSMPRPVEMRNPAMLGMIAVIAIALLAQLFYARGQTARGVLR